MEAISPKQFLIAAGLLAIGSVTGFYLGRYSLSGPIPQSQNQSKQIVFKNPLFKSQSATFEGEITGVEGLKLTVKDYKDQTGVLTAIPNLIIYGSGVKKAATDSASIELNKKAVLTLEVVDGQYKVISISYLPPAPPSKK